MLQKDIDTPRKKKIYIWIIRGCLGAVCYFGVRFAVQTWISGSSCASRNISTELQKNPEKFNKRLVEGIQRNLIEKIEGPYALPITQSELRHCSEIMLKYFTTEQVGLWIEKSFEALCREQRWTQAELYSKLEKSNSLEYKQTVQRLIDTQKQIIMKDSAVHAASREVMTYWIKEHPEFEGLVPLSFPETSAECQNYYSIILRRDIVIGMVSEIYTEPLIEIEQSGIRLTEELKESIRVASILELKKIFSNEIFIPVGEEVVSLLNISDENFDQLALKSFELTPDEEIKVIPLLEKVIEQNLTEGAILRLQVNLNQEARKLARASLDSRQDSSGKLF